MHQLKQRVQAQVVKWNPGLEQQESLRLVAGANHLDLKIRTKINRATEAASRMVQIDQIIIQAETINKEEQAKRPSVKSL
ncbi:hypothetical protein D3C73_1422750 [compost metagenome]